MSESDNLAGPSADSGSSSTYNSLDGDTVPDGKKHLLGYTVDEAITHIGFGRAQLRFTLITGIAWLADGMEIMVLSILGPTLRCVWHTSTWQTAFLTTVVFLGYLFGSAFFGYVSDKVGRRMSLIVSSIIGLIFGVACGLSINYTMLAVLRFGVGIGVGGLPQTVTYFSEFCPTKYRGKYVILIEMFFAIGGVLEVILAMVVMKSGGWRIWLILTAFPLLVFLTLCHWLPKSPRYLLACGDTKGAKEVLEKVAEENGTTLPEGDLLPEPKVPRGRFQDLIVPKYRFTTSLVFFIWLMLGFSYYGSVLVSTELISRGSNCVGESDVLNGYYTNSTHQNSTLHNCKPLKTADYVELMWTSAAELPSLAITAILVDILGRRILFGVNFTIFATSFFCLMICVTKIPMLLILFVGRAVIASALQVAYLYTPEIYPTQIRAVALGAGSACARVGALITPYFADVLIHHSIKLTLGIYGLVGVLSVIASALLPIETKGRGLQGTDVLH